MEMHMDYLFSCERKQTKQMMEAALATFSPKSSKHGGGKFMSKANAGLKKVESLQENSKEGHGSIEQSLDAHQPIATMKTTPLRQASSTMLAAEAGSSHRSGLQS